MKNHLQHLLFLGKALFLALLFFGLSRFVFVCFTFTQFPSIFNDGLLGVFLQGVRFDLSSIAYLNLFFILCSIFPTRKREKPFYQRLLKVLFLFFNGFALFLNTVDIVNVHFTGKRMTADIVSFLFQGEDATHVAGDFMIDYWFLFLIFFLLVIALNLGYTFIQKNQFFLYRSKNNWKSYVLSLLVLIFTVLAMRGGTQLRPLKNIHASYYANGKYVPLILNTPFSILSTLSETGLQDKNYFSSQELNTHFNAERTFSSDSANAKNVVVVILESFAREYIGGYNTFRGYTPFLDSLMLHSTVCTSAYANGKKSIEGIPAVLSGLPALSDKPFILSQYGTQKGNSIAAVLAGFGYNSSFYHGGHPGTMGFDAYAEIADFDAYLDMSNYPNSEADYDGKWGIFDAPFLQFYKAELDRKQQPFFSSIFTLSSHHPYTIPDQYKGVFPKGDLPIHESIGYSDYALKQFFEEAKKSSWFLNTIFVITADHTFKSTQESYQNSNGMYAIPLLVYEPSVGLPDTITKVCQQTDILPTVVDVLNLDTSLVCFGNSIFDTTGFAINYLNSIYQYFEDDYLLQFNGIESIGLYHVKTDSILNENILDLESFRAKKMERKVKAIIQEYNARMIHNNLKLNE